MCFGKHGKVGLFQSHPGSGTLAGLAQRFFRGTLSLWPVRPQAWLSGCLYLPFLSGRGEAYLDLGIFKMLFIQFFTKEASPWKLAPALPSLPDWKLRIPPLVAHVTIGRVSG